MLPGARASVRERRQGPRRRQEEEDERRCEMEMVSSERTFVPPLVSKLTRVLVERLAYRAEALLLLAPVAAAGHGAVDHQIMAIDETRLVAGEEYRGMRDVVGQAGARNWLRGFEDFAHHRGGVGRPRGRAPPRSTAPAPCRKCRSQSRRARSS